MKTSMMKTDFSSQGSKRPESLSCTVSIDADNVDFLGDIIFQAGSVDCGCGAGCEVAPLSMQPDDSNAKKTDDR